MFLSIEIIGQLFIYLLNFQIDILRTILHAILISIHMHNDL